MAIGTLGRKIIFEVSDDYMFTFKDMTREITSRWANHEPQGVKPKPEFLGPGLQSSSLTITLSSALGVRPRTVLEEIENMVETGTAERLVIGTRPVGKNPVRLTGSSETWDVIYKKSVFSGISSKPGSQFLESYNAEIALSETVISFCPLYCSSKTGKSRNLGSSALIPR